MFRGLGAYIIVGATFTACVCVLFSTNPALDHFRTSAWSTLIGISGAAIGALFAVAFSPKSDSWSPPRRAGLANALRPKETAPAQGEG